MRRRESASTDSLPSREEVRVVGSSERVCPVVEEGMVVVERVHVEEEKRKPPVAAEEEVDGRSPTTVGEGLVARSSIVESPP